jgi:O-antigen ligase
MPQTIRQLLFFLVFDVLLMFLFLFSETFLGLYVVMGFSILFITHFSWLDFSFVRHFKKLLILWFLLLLGLIFSGLFTHAIPLTINSFIFYFFSFISFTFFSLVKEEKVESNFLLWNLLLVMFVVNLMGLLLFFVPSLSELIPGMNLVFSSYGHNHLGALLILFIPLVWFYMVSFWRGKDRQKFILFSSLLVLFLVNLLISFGRVVILIGFFEITLLGFLSFKDLISQKKIFKVIYFFFVSLFILVIFAKVALALLTTLQPNFSCQLSFAKIYKNKLCKDFSQEARPGYWQTATLAIKDNWWLGYGPGTYSLISSKYKLKPDLGTSYAHNAYLKVFAESGVLVFLSFTFLMFFGWWKSTQVAVSSISLKKGFKFKGHLSITQALFISISAIYLDVLFDFDWSFLGVFLITWIFIVTIFRFPKSVKQKRKRVKKKDYFSVLVKVVFLIVSFILLGVGLLGLGSEVLIHFGKSNQVVKHFPYLQIHMKLFILDKSIEQENYKKLGKVYQNYPQFYSRGDQVNIFMENKDKILEIDPWYFYSPNRLTKLYGKEPVLAEQELVKLNEFYQEAKNDGSGGYFQANQSLANLSSKVGDDYLTKRDFDKAATFYHMALGFDEWVWNETMPAFAYLIFSDEEEMRFWSQLDDVNEVFFAKHRDIVASSYLSFVELALEEESWDEFFAQLEKVHQIEPWVSERFILDKETVLQKKADELIIKENLTDSLELLRLLSSIKDSYWSKSQLANFYFLQTQDELALQAFKECSKDWGESNDGARHDECYYGEKGIEEGWGNRDRYHQVSKIIRGLATWEDFAQ